MEILLLILAMAAVTYIPKVVPAIFIDKMKFGKKTEKFLSLIPYTAMAALIFPGVLSADENSWQIGVDGGLVAILLSVIGKISMAITVFVSVGVVMLMYTFM